MKAYPVTNLGWSEFYADRFNKTGQPVCANLACWYYLRHLVRLEEATTKQ